MKQFVLLLLSIGFLACGSKKENKESQASENLVKPAVSVVNYPLYYFAERIAGDYIELNFPVPGDLDPAYWIPNSNDLTLFQESELILTNGADYAKWLNNVSLPERIMVNTSALVKDKYIKVQEGLAHSHGDGEEHIHTGIAFTTWLDLSIAAEQARSIKDALIKLLPEKSAELEKNFEPLQTELLSMHNKLKALSLDETIIGSHPVYQYLARAYDLNIKSVHLEPGEEPTPKQWHDFDHFHEHYPSELMLWEDEPLKIISELIEIKGLNIVVFNPCGNKPDDGDFMRAMKRNIEALAVYSR